MAPAASSRVVSPRSQARADGVDVSFRGVERHVHVGELGLHELETADRLAELGALMDVGNDQVEAGLHQAERACRQHRALVVEAGHQHVDAVADDAEHVLGRHLAILKHDFAGVGAAHAELVELLAGRETRKRLLDDEGGDAAGAGGAVGLGIDHERVGDRPVGDPHLRAVENVAVALLVGAGAHRHHVGAGARLRHRQRADMLAGNQFRQIAASSARRCRCAGSG